MPITPIPTCTRTLRALLVLAFASPAAAQNVVNQNNSLANGGGFTWIGKWTGVNVYQTFKQSAANISGAGFYLSHSDANAGHPYFGGATITISLLDTLEGTVLRSVSTVAASTGWVDVFWNALNVTPTKQYALQIKSDEINYGLLVDYGQINPYANGNAWLFHDYFDQGNGSSYGLADLTFRTYTDITPASTVPEPGSFALLGTGLAGLVGVAGRRRRRTS